MTPRFYKIALVISLLLNVLSIIAFAGLWYWSSIEDTLGFVKMVVEMFD